MHHQRAAIAALENIISFVFLTCIKQLRRRIQRVLSHYSLGRVPHFSEVEFTTSPLTRPSLLKCCAQHSKKTWLRWVTIPFVSLGLAHSASAAITYIQSNSVIDSPVTSVAVPYTDAQGAGDLNVVVVGWNDSTSHVLSVTDTKGNTYTVAAGATTSSGNATSVIYYAKNIIAAAGNDNSVTVTFDAAVPYADVRIAEYSGIDTVNPLDVAVGAAGDGTAMNSGSVTTTNANDLLVGGNTVAHTTISAGSGYTQRILTGYGDILEDRVVSAIGSYSATADQDYSGHWVMQMAAFKATNSNGDTQAPTAPTSLTTTATSSSQINLSWTASTDNVGVTGYRIERCSGASCTTFAQITATTITTYSDTGRMASTSYSYRVLATDTAGNLSAYSNTASATTAADAEPPTAPSGLTASTASSTQIDLTWTSSTDNVGVTSYRVERCSGASCTNFAQIATTGAVSYSDAELAASTSYRYRVRASDAAGNLSSYSGTATATTQAGGGGIAYRQSNSVIDSPTASVVVPYTNAQLAGNFNVVVVGWNDSTSHVVSVTDTKGNIYEVAASAATSAGNATSVIYYAKNILAAAGNANSVTVTFDTAVPYADVRIAEYSGIDTVNPLDVAVSASGDSAAMSSGAVTTTNANDLLIGGNTVAHTTINAGSGYTQRILTGYGDILEDRVVSTAGSYSASADQDYAGHWVMQMAAFKAASGSGDTQAPTAPSGVTATAASSTQINLSWTASTDNVGVTGYRIERCQGASCTTFAQIATPTATSYSDTGLTASTSYSYRIRATDAAGNLSTYSATASATTQSAGDVQAPTIPAGLFATATSTTQIDLGWSVSTDNVGVTAYLLERCQDAGCTVFTQIASLSGTSYSDTNLTPSTSYSYRVRATDAATNTSGYSNTVSATTHPLVDTQAPTAPTGIAAAGISTTQISVSWNVSSDNVGVTAYLLERCQGSGCSNFGQIASVTGSSYTDSGLTPATIYVYRVRARDAANNISDYSSTASATLQYTGPITYTYSYDSLGRISHATGSDGSSIDYSYDANGNVTLINRQ